MNDRYLALWRGHSSSVIEIYGLSFELCYRNVLVGRIIIQSGYGIGGQLSMTPSTFVVRIIRCANGTWQGRIGHTQTGEMRPFQSCLEMIKIMDDFVGTGRQVEKETGRHAVDWSTAYKG